MTHVIFNNVSSGFKPHYSSNLKMNRYAGNPDIAEPNLELQNWLRDLVVAGG